MLAHLLDLVQNAGPWLLPALALASLIEYVFPPFPGDTIVALGAALAARGDISPAAVLLVTSLGSLAGGYLDYRFGVYVKTVIEHPHGARFRRWFPPERIAALEAQYRRWGPWLILANRFVPVSRALFYVFAGMSDVSLALTLSLGTLSAIVWNAMLLAIGYAVGANLDRVLEAAQQVGVWSLAAAATVAGGVALIVWLRRRATNRSRGSAAP